uniref:Uncharacterized protein n=1 Tax=Romanomermis culicivorax TaxID=13658 RepID=A0A915IRG8_ROMCU
MNSISRLGPNDERKGSLETAWDEMVGQLSHYLARSLAFDRELAHHLALDLAHELPLGLPSNLSQTLANHLPHDLARHFPLDSSCDLAQQFSTV